jgi:hypothetical protein
MEPPGTAIALMLKSRSMRLKASVEYCEGIALRSASCIGGGSASLLCDKTNNIVLLVSHGPRYLHVRKRTSGNAPIT